MNTDALCAVSYELWAANNVVAPFMEPNAFFAQ